ncbi:MAG: hypothetical protein FJ148_15280 [Deltaproteobacteria bacterium]|nr:hypothetical protein [Deltaproteobacteria bacterium]
MRRAPKRIGRVRRRGLPQGALAVAVLSIAGAAAAATDLVLEDGRLAGEVRASRVDDAVAMVARAAGGRLVWHGAAPEGAVHADLAGSTVAEALARLLRERSYMLLLGRSVEVHVLASGDTGWHSSASVDPETERQHLLRRIASLDRLVAQGDGADETADLDAVSRGADPAPVRLRAAERLLDLDPERAAAALARLSAEADDAIRARAEALLAAARDRVIARRPPISLSSRHQDIRHGRASRHPAGKARDRDVATSGGARRGAVTAAGRTGCPRSRAPRCRAASSTQRRRRRSP